MPKTFTNEPLGNGFRYQVRCERGVYAMGKSWIDTTQPSDMMDYDMTMPIQDGKAMHDEIRLMNIALQSCHSERETA